MIISEINKSIPNVLRTGVTLPSLHVKDRENDGH